MYSKVLPDLFPAHTFTICLNCISDEHVFEPHHTISSSTFKTGAVFYLPAWIWAVFPTWHLILLYLPPSVL